MSKSRARFLAEVLGSTGLVKKSKSALAGADEVIDLTSLPSLPNSKLTNSSITINSSAISLGGSVTLTTANVAENTNLYYTDTRARAAISVSGNAISYNNSTGVLTANFEEGPVFTSAVTANAGITVDNITIDGSAITAGSANDLTIDAVGDIILDADGGDVRLKDAGTAFARLGNSGTDLIIESLVADRDIVFKGLDGSSVINALILDMSDGGAATFNNDIYLADNRAVRFGDQQDFRIYNDGNHTTFHNASTNHDMIFKGSDDGAPITALTLDMSNAGKATFNGIVSSASGFERGNLFITQNEIDVSSGDLLLDIAGTIKLDSDNTGTVYFQDGGTIYGIIERTSSSMRIRSGEQDGDIIFMGNDNGTNITALTLDISDAGTANFNNNITLSDNKQAQFGDGADGTIHHDGSHFRLRAGTGNFNVQANDFHLTDASNNAVSFLVDHDGATSLRYNQTQKLATTSTGIDVTGTAVVDGLTSSGAITSTSNSNSLGGTTFTSAITTAGLTSSAAITSTTSNSNALGGTNFTGIISVDGNTLSDTSRNIYTGNIQASGYLRGPSTFTIDPATHGDNTGTVVIAGNLQVDGTTTTINSTTVNVDDVNIQLATGASNAAAAAGAGLTVDRGSDSDTYFKLDTAGSHWISNQPIHIQSNSGLGIGGDASSFGSGVSTILLQGTAANGRAGALWFKEQDGTNTTALYSTDGADGYGTVLAAYQGKMQFGIGGLAAGNMGLVIDTAKKVGIGTTTPQNKLHVKAGASGATTFDSRYNITVEDDGESYLGFYTPNNSFSGVRFVNADNSIRGHIDYYHGTQGDKFVAYSQNGWEFQYPSVGLQQQFKSNGNVNLGAAHSGFSGWRVLNIRQSTTGGMVNFDLNSGTRAFTFANQGVGMRYQAHITAGYHRFETHALGSGTAMMITDPGNVGIGTATPYSGTGVRSLTVNADNYPTIALQRAGTNVGATFGYYNHIAHHALGSRYMSFHTNDTERLRIADDAAALMIGGTTNAGFIDFDGTSLQLNTQRNPNTGSFVNTGRSHAGITLRGADGSSEIRFYTTNNNNSTGVERVRIADDGKVAIGHGFTPLTHLHVNKGSTGYQPATNVEKNYVAINTDYDGTGTQGVYFSHLTGNHIDGSSGADSQYGMLFGYQNAVRGGLIYDHRGTEIMTLWSSYGPLRFMTADSVDGNGVPIDTNIKDRLTILNGGYIGINKSVPTARLHIDQSGNTRNDGLFIERNGSTYGLNLYVDSSGYGVIGGNGSFTPDIMKFDFNLQDVGIGTAPSNQYRLEVYDGDYTQLMLRGPNYPMLKFKADNQNSGNNATIGLGASNSLHINPNNVTTGIVVSNDGSVGLGTTSSGERLHVSGNVLINHPDGGGSPAMTATLLMYGYEGRGVGIKIRDSVNSASGASNREWFVGSGYGQSGFNIGYAADGSQSSYAAQNKLTILTDGRVGIGESTPNADSAVEISTPAPNTGVTTLRLTNSVNNKGQRIDFEDDNAARAFTIAHDNGSNIAYMGTLVNEPFLFYANSIERMRITSGGAIYCKEYSQEGDYTMYIGSICPAGSGNRYLHVRISTQSGEMFWIEVMGYDYISADVIEGRGGGYVYNAANQTQVYARAIQGDIVQIYQSTTGNIELVIDTGSTQTTNRWGSVVLRGGTDTITASQPLEIVQYSWTANTDKVY